MNNLYYSKPKIILSTLRERNDIPEKYIPKKPQVASFAFLLRKKLIEKYVKNNEDSLNNFIQNNSWSNINQDTQLICLHGELNPDKFLLVITSKILLTNILRQYQACGNTYLYIDATYKLINNGFSLLTLGVENKSHNFRFVACAISAHENTEAYTCFLSKISEALETQYNLKLQPILMVSDAADCIHNAIEKVFPNCLHIRCYFHVMKAVKDKINRWKEPNEKSQLKESWGKIHYSISLLHRTKSFQDFRDLWSLIKVDWEEKIPKTFIEYFDKNYVQNNKKLQWNRMNLIGKNLSNNGLERFHEEIKLSFTEKKVLKLNDFLYKCSRLVKDYSIEHNEKFQGEIKLSKECWKKALTYLADPSKGPFLEIIPGLALFVKKKRDIEKLELRIK